MADFYVPWPERKPTEFRGPAKVVAALSLALYRIFGPPIRRFPGVVFFGTLIAACLVTWLVGVAVQASEQAVTYAVRNEIAGSGATLTVAQLGEAAGAQNIAFPAAVLYPFQFGIVRDLLGIVAIVLFVSVLPAFLIWWERKVAGHIQSRLGPMRVGAWHGWSQSAADGVKLLAKEDFVPDGADAALFKLAPYLSFVPAILTFLVIPFGVFWVFRDLDIALLFILAMLGIEVMGVLLGGWASNNKWSVYGAMREACQVVAYEIPLGLSLLVPIMAAGSLRLSEIAAVQQGGWFNWLAWHSPWTFAAMFTYFVAALASCKRAPFDLPEAESELVAGFHTEYSGFRWALFFFAEYAAMFIVAGVCVILFLGAWDAPWALQGDPGTFLFRWQHSDNLLARLAWGVAMSGPVWFIVKGLFLVYLQIWLRWTLPRLRIDQVLFSCLQVMLPLVMVVLLGSTIWELFLERGYAVFDDVARWISLGLALFGALMALAVIYVGWVGMRRTPVGGMAVQRPLAGG